MILFTVHQPGDWQESERKSAKQTKALNLQGDLHGQKESDARVQTNIGTTASILLPDWDKSMLKWHELKEPNAKRHAYSKVWTISTARPENNKSFVTSFM